MSPAAVTKPNQLEIARTLSLPVNAATQKLAMVGRTGSGKTYGATKLAELMHAAGVQTVTLDPVGVWYGLRLAANGKDPGIAIPVFGGLHGDVPLEPSGGALLADLVVDRGISVICDVSQFEHDTDKARFARDFAARFFFRKKAHPSAVHIFLEECQEFIPERPQKGEEHMLHAFQRMWKLGRNFGIGGTLISQRPQDVNKKALNLTECVFAFQLTGPHERKALETWIAEKGLDEDIQALLPKLSIGEARVWSPAWLKVSQTVKISHKWTFNASSTPEVGGRSHVRELAPIDLEKIRADMAATIERAKGEDPKHLRAEIAKLRSELSKKAGPVQDENATKRAIESALAQERKNTERLISSTRRAIAQAVDGLRAIAQKLETAAPPDAGPSAPAPVFVTPPPRPLPAALPRVQRDDATSSDAPTGGLRRMLIALAQRPSGLTAGQLAVRAGLSSKGGSFGTYLSKARTNGWIRGQNRDRMTITPEGVAAIGTYTPLPEGPELLAYWVSELGSSGASRMLQALADAYPKALTYSELGEKSGISTEGGSFGTYLSKLRTLELIEGSRDALRASEELF